MKPYNLIHSIVAFGLIWVALAAPAQSGTIFNVNFDDTFGRDLDAPFVGSGTISVDDVLSDGTYPLGSLTNFEASFTIGTSVWTQADLATSITSALVVYDSGTEFYFAGSGAGDLKLGSVEFFNGSQRLVFENDMTTLGTPYNQYSVFESGTLVPAFSGTYGAEAASATVPEPAGLAVLSLLGVVGIGSLRRRRKIC